MTDETLRLVNRKIQTMAATVQSHAVVLERLQEIQLIEVAALEVLDRKLDRKLERLLRKMERRDG
jgi:hypothetical protein